MVKKELRDLFREKRRQLTDEESEVNTLKIAHRIYEFLDLHPGINYLHTFLPAAGRRELNTFLIRDFIRQRLPEIKWVVPKVTEGSRRLTHYLFHDELLLSPSRWGIPEPVDGEIVVPQQIDMVLVPLLAYDQNGNRVGYGGGFYDQFLRACRGDTIKSGVSFFDPVPAISDAEPHDVRLDLCFTPDRTWNFTE